MSKRAALNTSVACGDVYDFAGYQRVDDPFAEANAIESVDLL
jgi:hypothetical protein